MRKNKSLPEINILYLLYFTAFIIFIIFMSCVCSCEKREPEAQPLPNDMMKKILDDLAESYDSDSINSDCVEYISEQKDKNLSEKDLNDIYSDGENQTPVDMSKIEKYSIRQSKSKENPPAEIGIFKLYDEVNAQYVKDMANNRIKKIIDADKSNNNNNLNLNININSLETANNAEARSYGNYVYYVSHPEKDRIFRIIENMLRDKNKGA